MVSRFMGVFAALISVLVLTANCEDAVPTDIIFCGNPGVGKSTLLSAISGLHFRSGTSWGEGMTSVLECKTSPQYSHLRFCDTPGLGDIAMAEKAGEAITTALKDAARQRRIVKVFFVITIEAGRVRSGDVFTIKQVMNSIKLPDESKPGMNSYALIANKCDFLNDPDFLNDGQFALQAEFQVSKRSLPFTTEHFEFLARTDAPTERSFAAKLSDFVARFPGLLAISDAENIDVRDIDERISEAAARYKKDLEEMRDEILRLKEQLKWKNAAVAVGAGTIMTLAGNAVLTPILGPVAPVVSAGLGAAVGAMIGM